jgi:hypothetical protein
MFLETHDGENFVSTRDFRNFATSEYLYNLLVFMIYIVNARLSN